VLSCRTTRSTISCSCERSSSHIVLRLTEPSTVAGDEGLVSGGLGEFGASSRRDGLF